MVPGMTRGKSFLVTRAMNFRRELILISVLALLSALATLALPWLAGQFLAGVFVPGRTAQGMTVAALVTILAVSTVLGVAAQVVSAHASGRILAALRVEAYNHIQSLPLVFHHGNRQGDLISIMVGEVDRLSQFLTSTLARAPAMLLTVAGSTALLFVLNPRLAIIVPVLVPGFYIVLKVIGRALRNIAAKSREAQARLFYLSEEHLSILSATKSFAVEEQQAEVYAEAVEDARRLTFAHGRISAAVGPIAGLTTALAAVAILLVLGQQTDMPASDPARLFSFLLYAALLTRPVGSLAETYGQLQIARGALTRIEQVFAETPEPGYAAQRTPQVAGGAISVTKVSFAYPDRPPVLDQASLDIAAGETVALTGENGAGKSTLINLLLRFYDPARGTIYIDGEDIALCQVKAVRRLVGYVPQRPLLFNGTVRENIVFGRHEASEEQVRCAAEHAQALDFITALPQGFFTEIGDHGVRLSGGQQQRLALARALLVDPPILILDEATSMYDVEGEAAFIEACRNSLIDRTVIIVTHRPASLALADRIFRVEGGKLVEAAI